MSHIITYAHRGASEYAPENTLRSFYLGEEMGADGIETDIQMTKDGVLVLFHDDAVQRILNIPGAISDYTYAELLALDFGIWKGEKFRGERIVTFEEFLKHFSAKPLSLALEIKKPGYERECLEMCDRWAPRDKVTFTSFKFECLTALRSLDTDVKLGYLMREVTPGILDDLDAWHIGQICPRAADLTAEAVAECRARGLSVRAWGVSDETLMHKMIDLSVDGMTVNFPDKLLAALR